MSPRTEEQLSAIREKTRASILESALELFATKGFHGTSIGEIAKKAEISKGLAYHYFDSKQDILEAVIQEGIAEIEELMNAAGKIKDSFQQIVILIERTFAMLAKDEHFWRLYVGLLLQPEIWENIRRLLQDFFDRAIIQFEQLFADIGVENPATEARILAALFDGISIHYMVDKENYPIEQIKDTLISKYSRENLLNK